MFPLISLWIILYLLSIQVKSLTATFTGTTFTDNTPSEASSPDVTTSNLTTATSLTETISQSIELASDCLAEQDVVELSSDSVQEILKT
ncbi:hypothetical protein HMPREF1544_11385, partial [Mucor circinelloides 1006PhL]